MSRLVLLLAVLVVGCNTTAGECFKLCAGRVRSFNPTGDCVCAEAADGGAR